MCSGRVVANPYMTQFSSSVRNADGSTGIQILPDFSRLRFVTSDSACGLAIRNIIELAGYRK
jgi:hypothetical protein